MIEGGSENGNNRLKGKGADRAREEARKEEIRKDQMYTGELKGKGLERATETSDELKEGIILINRDEAMSNPDTAEYVIESATGEPGKRHFILKNDKRNIKAGKGEESLRDGIARGVWRHKE